MKKGCTVQSKRKRLHTIHTAFTREINALFNQRLRKQERRRLWQCIRIRVRKSFIPMNATLGRLSPEKSEGYNRIRFDKTFRQSNVYDFLTLTSGRIVKKKLIRCQLH